MCNARRLGPCERSEQGPRRRALHIAQVTSGGARHKAARSGFTWATANARRRGPCERSEQGPRRRALAVAQCTAQSGEVWLHLTYQERPPTRVSRAKRARPEAAGVLGKSSEARSAGPSSVISNSELAPSSVVVVEAPRSIRGRRLTKDVGAARVELRSDSHLLLGHLLAENAQPGLGVLRPLLLEALQQRPVPLLGRPQQGVLPVLASALTNFD
ncbi:hypothetical protein TYRP_003862 [Tyrophagus putrescentiae]|nr:hypothetical protein TYRP_003862 [Tyrophagus putrescentiae]